MIVKRDEWRGDLRDLCRFFFDFLLKRQVRTWLLLFLLKWETMAAYLPHSLSRADCAASRRSSLDIRSRLKNSLLA